jgi:hypothetical protein
MNGEPPPTARRPRARSVRARQSRPLRSWRQQKPALAAARGCLAAAERDEREAVAAREGQRAAEAAESPLFLACGPS